MQGAVCVETEKGKLSWRKIRKKERVIVFAIAFVFVDYTSGWYNDSDHTECAVIFCIIPAPKWRKYSNTSLAGANNRIHVYK